MSKLVEDKDAQVLKLSEKVDVKFEQVLKAISEFVVPKVVERVIEKVIEKPGATSQEGGDKEGAEKTQPESETTRKSPPKQSKKTSTKKPEPKRPIQKGVIINPDEGSSKQKPTESEVPRKGKMIVTSDPNAAQNENPDTSKDEELARKIQEEERLKA